MPKMSVTNNHTAPYGVRADEADGESPWRMLKPGETATLTVEDDEVKRLKTAPITFKPVAG